MEQNVSYHETVTLQAFNDMRKRLRVYTLHNSKKAVTAD